MTTTHGNNTKESHLAIYEEEITSDIVYASQCMWQITTYQQQTHATTSEITIYTINYKLILINYQLKFDTVLIKFK